MGGGSRSGKPRVQLIHAPIVRTEIFKTGLTSYFNWYDSHTINDHIQDKSFDMVIVDGPKGAICPYARFPAIPFLIEKMDDSYAIILDDTNRENEHKILSEWSEILGEKISYMDLKYGCITKKTNFITFSR